MKRRTGILAAAIAAALLFFALGAAARPLLVTAEPTPAPVLSPTEIGFAQDMLAHHNQAIIMVSRLDRGADPAVLALADTIDNTQRGEIGELLGWLRLAGAPAVDPTPMAWMHDRAATAHHGHPAPAAGPSGDRAMPGMATQDELDALAAARGTEASTLFLRLMQRHHYGGIEMAAAANNLLKSGVVKQTARDMMSNQGQEAGLMGMLLSSIGPNR